MGPLSFGRMTKLRILLLAGALLVALPAADAAAKARYKTSVSYERTYREISDCRTITNGDAYGIKETIEGISKWIEVGYFPGSTRRTGYREETLTRETDDPYLQPGTFKTRKDINEAFGPESSDFQTGRKGKLIFNWVDHYGETQPIAIRAPKVGKTVTKTFQDADAPDRPDDSRCTNTAEWETKETVTVKRVR